VKGNAVAEIKEPVLVQLLKLGVDIDSLDKPRNYDKPLVDLIRKSPAICEMAKQPWEFKSLAQYGSEQFCESPITGWYEPNLAWRSLKGDISIQGAIKVFSESVCEMVGWVDRGLRLFVKEGSGYRVATMDDEDYKFVVRLSNEENGQFDLRFRSPPQWAHNLYLNSRALQVWEWFCSDYNDHDENLLRARKDAIARILDDEMEESTEKTTRPESTRKTENLLRTVASIAIDAYGYDPELPKSNAPQDIAEALAKSGHSIDPKTIRSWLKEGVTLLPPSPRKN
jgi:hypothetical protein